VFASATPVADRQKLCGERISRGNTTQTVAAAGPRLSTGRPGGHGRRSVACHLVAEIDRLQYRTREGPCVDAIAEHETYRADDLAAESRWPRIALAAAEAGVRSMLSYRLFLTDTTLGALNLYAGGRDAFSDRTEQDGLMFATHATIALAAAQQEAHLRAAFEHRDTIGMAKGILMQRHDLDPVQAFRMLVEASQHSNTKLHEVAVWLVEHRSDL
jgi:GAF domain-containing protein